MNQIIKDSFQCTGLVWPQLSSELLQLTKEERMRGMEVLAKAAKGKKSVLTLVLGVQGDDTKEMLEYTIQAVEIRTGRDDRHPTQKGCIAG